MSVSFQNDILPFLYPWRAQMLWRLDLAKYEDVMMNASVIWDQISTDPPSMPPPPMQPLTADEVATFKAWMDGGYPP